MNEIEKIKRKFDSDLWFDNADEIIDIIAVILFIILIVSIIGILLHKTKFCPECGELY